MILPRSLYRTRLYFTFECRRNLISSTCPPSVEDVARSDKPGKRRGLLEGASGDAESGRRIALVAAR